MDTESARGDPGVTTNEQIARQLLEDNGVETKAEYEAFVEAIAKALDEAEERGADRA
jgi:hypothetical protein